MNILESVKQYFGKKIKNETDVKTPEGICPNCWGKQEWDGQFYKKIVANNITPEHNEYNSFIHEVSSKLDKITLKKDTYSCETCQVSYKK